MKCVGVLTDFFQKAPVDADTLGAVSGTEHLKLGVVPSGAFVVEPFHETG
jgi:hypothetical protein